MLASFLLLYSILHTYHTFKSCSPYSDKICIIFNGSLTWIKAVELSLPWMLINSSRVSICTLYVILMGVSNINKYIMIIYACMSVHRAPIVIYCIAAVPRIPYYGPRLHCISHWTKTNTTDRDSYFVLFPLQCKCVPTILQKNQFIKPVFCVCI